MNEPFSFGAPERRRFAVQFGYDMRPSFWQGLRSNAHLVIAAVGTAALLGVAAVALWLALPAHEKQAIASAQQTVPAIPVKTKKITPAVANAAVTVAAPRAARKADAVSPITAAREAAIPALASNSPRWTDPGAAPASASPAANPAANSPAANAPAEQKTTAAAFAESVAQSDAANVLSKVAAPAPMADQSADAKKPDDKMDGAQTAAIPDVKPQVPEAQPAAADQAAQDKPQTVSAAANGRILRPVTMRTGPKKGAAAIITIPAKASVQVMSCKKWCEIVYDGKHGWVYKTYVKTGT
ncbi:SH3 domain-containing protein [Mesorhizobium sp. ORS 3428]|uniref:SH3 domain-containing protein n=1 Tax=Mesorhizobium sp. ORS 3428 TaxID=540997 RepID=UPI0008DAF0B2|nr:SH3 domain-containing protein [Mesorhizobium sp. ORS 3428]OHV88638.1 peptide-binding protein [Mesorhizobium sp. ORS 3428]